MAAIHFAPLCVIAGLIAPLAPANALDVSSVQRAIGSWELSRDNGQRKCAIQLRAEPTAGGNAIGLPATCRNAIPAVGNVAAWNLTPAGRIDLLSQTGVAILSFSAQKNAMVATGAGGETYVLMTAADVAQGAARPTGVAPAPAGPAVRPGDVPGRYAVLREGTKDTGCMLTLDSGARGGGSRAQLAPACRDNGFVIFDPQSWAFVGGKLKLTARKGHSATFEMTADGTWQKDPKEGGKPLGFRKM
ncbi:MAG: AprI/Inh family metalloprotease inhibitor [Beijerinckiaceae bacterium]